MQRARIAGLGLALAALLWGGYASAQQSGAAKAKAKAPAAAAHPELRWFSCAFEGATELNIAGTSKLEHQDEGLLIVVDDSKRMVYGYDPAAQALDPSAFAGATVSKTYMGWSDTQQTPTGNLVQISINFDIARKQINKLVQLTVPQVGQQVVREAGRCNQIPAQPLR